LGSAWGSLVGIEPVLTYHSGLFPGVESLLILQAICSVRTVPEQARFAAPPRGGGRTWWAHFKFTPINIALTIHKNQFEEFREAGATLLNAAALGRTYLVSRIFTSWNPLISWLRQLDGLRAAA
jgi:hypothetical protein